MRHGRGSDVMTGTRAARLVGDVGGTHARFRLLAGTASARDALDVRAPETLDCRDHQSLEAALQAFLDAQNAGVWPEAGSIAVAGPVAGGEVAFTNLGWRTSERDLTGPDRFRRVRLLNDFAACALALPALEGRDLLTIGPEVPGEEAASLAVLGPGTGFGVAALIREGPKACVAEGEGGHAAFAPQGERQIEILRALARRFGRVSLERLLSGPGVVDIYEALRTIEGRGPVLGGPEAVSAAAGRGEALAEESLQIFCEVLGAAAGDFVLAFGARGGLYIAGGVALSLKSRLADGRFRKAFEDKGRFSAYLAAVPTKLISHPFPNLLGALAALVPDAATL